MSCSGPSIRHCYTDEIKEGKPYGCILDFDLIKGVLGSIRRSSISYALSGSLMMRGTVPQNPPHFPQKKFIGVQRWGYFWG